MAEIFSDADAIVGGIVQIGRVSQIGRVGWPRRRSWFVRFVPWLSFRGP
jgi:hypothetical protein